MLIPNHEHSCFRWLTPLCSHYKIFLLRVSLSYFFLRLFMVSQGSSMYQKQCVLHQRHKHLGEWSVFKNNISLQICSDILVIEFTGWNVCRSHWCLKNIGEYWWKAKLICKYIILAGQFKIISPTLSQICSRQIIILRKQLVDKAK